MRPNDYFIPFLIALSIFTGNSFAQDSFSFHAIISEGLQASEEIEMQHPNLNVLRMEYDVASEHNYSYLTLEANTMYVITCFGDENIKDVTLSLNTEYKGQLTEIVSKSDYRNKATLRINPERKDLYVIDVRVNEFAGGKTSGHYGLIICSVGKEGESVKAPK